MSDQIVYEVVVSAPAIVTETWHVLAPEGLSDDQVMDLFDADEVPMVFVEEHVDDEADRSLVSVRATPHKQIEAWS